LRSRRGGGTRMSPAELEPEWISWQWWCWKRRPVGRPAGPRRWTPEHAE
jgi:hypothetical protein